MPTRDLSRPVIPIWKKKDEFGRWIFGLSPEDYQEVTDGVACPTCLERWPMQMAVCPVCRQRPDGFGLIVELPEDWREALLERAAEEEEAAEARERRRWEARRGR